MAARASSEARPLAVVLPRQPGSREARSMHLLGGPVDAAQYASTAALAGAGAARGSETGLTARVSALEVEVAELREAVARLASRLAD